jgi:DNA primase
VDKNQIKEYLKDNPEQIKTILEYIGCHHVKIIKDKRVQSARPEGDNATSVQVSLKSNFLSTVIKTKNDFENFNGEEYQDIFTLIQYINGCNFSEAIELACKICDLKYDRSIKKSSKSDSLAFLKKYKRSVGKEKLEDIVEVTYGENFKTRFIRQDCKLFYDDGIYSDTQDKFDVSYDVLDNRIVFPIRNYEGNIVSFKGRTNDVDYKIKGIPKYIYYYPIDGRFYLYGYYENYYDILSSDEVLVGESEKFVQQLDSMEIHNAVSISKKVISLEQLNRLMKLHKDIVLCFDKDVTLEEIYIECKKFRGLCNVYYIYDYDNLLKAKQSPSDCGIEIFNKLYAEYKFKYEGE